MPAPAPCAKTKQARALSGRISNADNELDLPTSMRSFCGETSVIVRTAADRLRLQGNGDPGMTRTCDLRFRKPPLYPAELRDQANYIKHLSKPDLERSGNGWFRWPQTGPKRVRQLANRLGHCVSLPVK